MELSLVNRKRILLFIDSLGSGGAQRQMTGLAVLLKRNGYDVKVLTYYPLDFYKGELDAEKITNVCVNTGRNFLMRIVKVWNEVHRFSPDVVISFLDTPNKIACAIKGLTSAKWRLIVGERNTTVALSKNEREKFRLFRWADAIVSNSKSQAEFITENYPKLIDKVVTITNFVDINYFSPVDEIKKTRNDKKKIICVGRISPQKNIQSFLKALKKVEDNGYEFSVEWYGCCTDRSYFEECESIINRLKVSDFFIFNKPDKNIRDRYREADIFCLPSLYEGYPNVLCEAMSCGLPVICSDVCDNPDIAENGKSGFLFDPHNIDSMVDALVKILSLSSSEILEIGKYNRERSINIFSTQRFFDKYKDVING